MVLEKNVLGQVFTSQKVARLMVNLLKPFFNSHSTCLDPCIGGNVFFEELSRYKHGSLTGIEFDETLITQKIKDFYDSDNRDLIVGDFFDLDLDRKFDIIIMNPPYVRQELLNNGINSKEKISKVLGSDYHAVPGKSNLYIYFLQKALKHLREKGVLVAITYDSWLFTDFGRSFKEFLFESHSLKKIIHFKKGAFDNVNVGATIIVVTPHKQHSQVDYYPFESPEELGHAGELIENRKRVISKEDILDFHNIHSNIVDFSSALFHPISMLSESPIIRGVNGLVNKFFIFDEDKFPPYTVKLVKEVISIKRFEIKNEYKYLLKLPCDVKGAKVNNYLKSIIKEVEAQKENYRSLRDSIEHNKDWFVIRGKAEGNVIFNYYIRNNPHFIYNPKRHLVADNFYNLFINKNVYANLSILNSSFTRFALFKFGKSQGRGLFKIQLGKFQSMPVIDVDKLSKESVRKLEELGRALCQTERSESTEILAGIDELLLSEVNSHLPQKISLAQLNKEIESIKGN